MSYKKISGKGIWTNWEDQRTGEKSLKEHELKVVKTWCPKGTHSYQIKDSSKRIALCTKCKQTRRFVLGKHEIKDNLVIID